MAERSDGSIFLKDRVCFKGHSFKLGGWHMPVIGMLSQDGLASLDYIARLSFNKSHIYSLNIYLFIY